MSKEVHDIIFKLLSGTTPVGYKLLQVATKIYQTYRIDPMPLITQILANLQKANAKSTGLVLQIELLGQIFQDVTLIQPQCKELVEALQKLIKLGGEMRKPSYEALAKILKTGHTMQISEGILKLLLKNPDKEHQAEWADCICAIILDYPSNFIVWGSVWQDLTLAGIREMESIKSHKILASLVRTRLQESQKQNNITTPTKQFTSGIKVDTKKKAPPAIEFARTMPEVISYFSKVMQKIHSTPNEIQPAQLKVCSEVSTLLQELFREFPGHLETVGGDYLLSQIIVTLQANKHTEEQKEVVYDILCAVVDVLDGTEYVQNLQMFIFECLKTKQLALSDQAPLKLGSYQLSVLLLVFQKYVSSSNENQVALKLQEKGESCNTFVDVMLPYLQSSSTGYYVSQLVLSMGKVSPIWLHQLISLFISCVQINSADFASTQPAYVYTQNKAQLSQVTTLNHQTELLTCLLKLTVKVIGGEPVALVNAAYQSASSFVVGRGSPQNFQKLQIDQLKLDTCGRREHGWTMIEGLLHQGHSWIELHIEELLVLFETAFSKSMCEVNQDRLAKDPVYQELYTQEFHTKARALRAMKVLFQQSLTKRTSKQIGSYLCHALDFLQVKDMKILDALVHPCELIQVRESLFYCMSKLPCQYYHSKLVATLHQICDVLVSSAAELPTSRFLDTQDEELSPALPSSKFKLKVQLWRFQYLYDDDLLLASGQKQVDPFSDYIEVTIKLFSKLFKSSAVSQTNKDQLVTHFMAHSQPSTRKVKQPTGETVVQQLPYRPEKIKKMQRVSCALLIAMRNCTNLKHYESQMLAVHTNLMKANDPTLVRISCELQIELFASELLNSGPIQLLDTIEETLTKNMRLNQHQELMLAGALCGHIVRHFDERIGTPIDRITNIFLKLFRSTQKEVIAFATHFAYQISLEYDVFRQQLLPAVFMHFYGSQSEAAHVQLPSFCAIAMKETNQYTDIMIQDHFNHKEVIKARLRLAKDSDKVFEHLDDYQVVQMMLDQGKLEKLQTNLKGRLMHHVIDQIQANADTHKDTQQMWKMIYQRLLILQIQNEGSLRGHLDFVRQQCLQYVHLSPLTLMDPEKEQTSNMFKSELNSHTLAYLFEEICWLVTEHPQPYKQVVEVMQLALSVIVNPSKQVKLTGFKLLNRTISLLSYTVEVVGDVDEDLSPRSRERQNYLNNPLLLEQFEAQIFSVIRSNLQAQGSELLHETVQASIELIYKFLTLPITHDAALIKKILAMLVSKDMEKGCQIFNGELFQHEGLIAQTHYLKLELLAKLVLKGQGHLPLIKDEHAPKSDMPSKFDNDDLEALKDAFDPKLIKVLEQHWRAAISDLLPMKDSNQKRTFLQGGTYSKEVIQNTLPYMIDALRITGSDQGKSLLKDCLLHGLTAQYENNLLKFYQQKITYLQLVQKSISLLFADSLSEIAPVLLHLTKLGIAEINLEVLKIYVLLMEAQIVKASECALTADQVIFQTLQVLIQAEPEFSGTPQLMASQQTRNQDLVTCCLQCLTLGAKIVTQNKQATSLQNLMEQVVSRLSLFIVKHTQHPQIKQYVQTLCTILQLFLQVEPADRQLISNFGACLLKELSQNDPSTTLDLVIVLLSELLHPDDHSSVLDSLKEYKSKTIYQILVQRNLAHSQLVATWLTRLCVVVREDVSVCGMPHLQFLMKVYKGLPDSHSRQKMLLAYFALLFSVLQCKAEGCPRMQAAADLYELFKFDVPAIRGFAMQVDGKGQPMLSGAEKTAAENIVRQYSAQQQEQPAKAAAQAHQPAQTSQQASSGPRKLEIKKLNKP